MPEHNINVLGLEVSFKANASTEQVEQALMLLESRFEKIRQHGRLFSKEKLLTFIALGLADDLVQANIKLCDQEARVKALLDNISENTSAK